MAIPNNGAKNLIAFQQVYWIVASNNKTVVPSVELKDCVLLLNYIWLLELNKKVPKLIEIMFEINNNNKIDLL